MSNENLLAYLKRANYPPSFRTLLAKHGGEIVTNIDVVRTPLSTWLDLILNILSLGEFNKLKEKNNYDAYFHLNLNIMTNKGNYFTLEKNSVLNFVKGLHVTENSEMLHVDNFPNDITIFELLENTRN